MYYYADFEKQIELLEPELNRIDSIREIYGLPRLNRMKIYGRLHREIQKFYGRQSKYKPNGQRDRRIFFSFDHPRHWMNFGLS